MTNAYTARSFAALSAFFLLIVLAGCSKETGPAPNVILITLDTTRADRLGCYGFANARTATLDSLAAAGIVFDQCISSVPVTLPSHSTILTGVSPLKHGVRDNGIFKLSEDFDTLAERLLGAGYQTGAFLSAYVLDGNFGTAQGFTTYDDKIVGERPARITNRHALQWIEKLDRTRPYFLWVHYYDPHEPWTAPEPYRSIPDMHPYDQEIASMDAAFGDFLRKLRVQGLLDNTVMLVVADHGEGLGDHGEDQHGVFLYDSTIRVPMILTLPDGKLAGRRVEDLVATEDVTPTLLDIVGVAAPDSIDGHALMPWVEGKTQQARSYAYSESYFPSFNFHHSNIFSLRSDRWKYVHAPVPELYHVRRDPKESIDLVGAYPDTVTAYRGRIDRLRGTAGVDVEATRAISKEEMERLQSLGYLGGGEFAAEMDPTGEFVLPDPKNMRPFLEDFEKGLLALTEQRFDEASERLERVIAQSPENVIARMNLGRIYSKTGEFEKAIAHLVEATKLAPNSSTNTKLLGTAYLFGERYDDALRTFRMIENDETHGNGALADIGRIQLLTGHPEEALRTFRHLADRVGGEANTYSGLGARVEQYLAARDRLEKVPGDERARLLLAEVTIDLRMLDEAERALSFRGTSTQIEAARRRALGSVAGARGDSAKARREFEAALADLPGDVYIRSHLLGLYLDAGELDRALTVAEELIKDGKGDATVYYNKACALSRLGRVDEALDALQRAIVRGYDDLLQLSHDPELEAVRKDPRFPDLLETVGETQS